MIKRRHLLLFWARVDIFYRAKEIKRVLILASLISILSLLVTTIVGCQQKPEISVTTMEQVPKSEPVPTTGLTLTKEPASMPETTSTSKAAPLEPEEISKPAQEPLPNPETVPASTQPSASESDSAINNDAIPTIAFTRWQDDKFEERIFLINLDGTGLKQLTLEDGVQEHFPSISPDGKKIAFGRCDEQSQFDIYVMNNDSSGRVRMTNTGQNNMGMNDMPVWSPDNSKIAFMSYRDDSMEIYIMNSDGSSQKRLTEDPAIDWLPVWSPDGSKIAFQSNRDGKMKWWWMNSDGSDQCLLADIEIWDEYIDLPIMLHQAVWTPFMGGTLYTPIITEEELGVIGIQVNNEAKRGITFADALTLVVPPGDDYMLMPVLTIFSQDTQSLDLLVLGNEYQLTNTPEHEVAGSCGILARP
jgi:hypothetical protein